MFRRNLASFYPTALNIYAFKLLPAIMTCMILVPIGFLVQDFYKWAKYRLFMLRKEFHPTKRLTSKSDPKKKGEPFSIAGLEFDNPKEIFASLLRSYMGYVVTAVFKDPDCNSEGLKFVDRLLHNDDMHEAAMIVLTDVLNDVRFVDGSNTYGTKLIEHVLQQPKT